MTPIFKFTACGFLTFIFVLLCSQLTVGQELDVLPIEGRNELFHTYLMEELTEQSLQRAADVEAALQSKELMEARQEMLRNNYRMLIGDLPEKTPLNPTIVNTISEDGYTIERVYFESRPNHHVTANFYYPTFDEGPFPAVLVTCGHYSVGKSINLYQSLCVSLAKNGFSVLIVDPICQGERNQILNPLIDVLYYSNESGTKAHSRLDVGATLVGSSVMAYELWDNHRAVDYLYTRTGLVDTTKVGLTGSSGGGAQATYLAAFDDRIKVAAVNSYIMNEPTLFSTIGPQTGSQNLSYEGEYSIDHPDYIAMFAPKPFMILAASKDFFDTAGTHQTLTEVEKIYDTLGVPGNIDYFEYNDDHGYSKPKREKAVQWFKRWFYNDNSAVTEPTGFPIYANAQLWATETGQVYTNFDNEKVVQQFNYDYALDMAAQRSDFWSNQTKDSCLSKVKELLKFDENYDTPTWTTTEVLMRDGYTIEKISATDGNLTPITGLLYIPDGVIADAPAVLYVDGRGKDTDGEEGGIIHRIYADSGKVVFAIDVRGFGETTDNYSKNESKHGNIEHRNSVISLYIGKTLIGQRVEDILKATDYLISRKEIDAENISIIGIDRAGTSVLHAAAIDDRLKEVEIRELTDTSWVTVIEDPTAKDNMTHLVPSAMKYYDLPDLIGAINPRPVTYAEEPTIPPISSSINSPSELGLVESCHPNPVITSATITYTINTPGKVSLKVYNTNGSEVLELVNEVKSSGTFKAHLSADQLNPGVYFYSLSINKQPTASNKLVVM